MKEVDTMTNTSTRKPTKRDHFNTLLSIPAVAENADLVAFIEHEVELLDKKNSAERKPTPKQTENAGIKASIVNWMESDTQYLAADVTKNCPACEGLTAQRVSALLSQQVADGSVVRTEDKRKNYYSLA